MATHGTSKNRNKRQKLKQTFSKLREEAQLQGIVPTTPEGAIRNERVDPSKQTEQQLPGLVMQAVRNGWATPDEAKPKIVDALIAPFLEPPATAIAPNGDEYEIPPDRHLLKENAKVLATLDKMQYDRDHPKEVADAGDVNINNQVNVVQVNWNALTVEPEYIDPVDVAVRELDAKLPAPEHRPNGTEQGAMASDAVVS